MHDHAGRDDLLDALGCAVVAVASYNSGSDPATIGCSSSPACPLSSSLL